MSAALPKLPSYREQPDFRWTSPESTAEIFALLGEILEPSLNGPFGRSYVEDERYEAFMDALWPVSQAYREHFPAIRNAAGEEQ